MKTVNYYFKALYFNFKGLNVLFSEPTQDLRDALTKTKLNRLIEQNELLRNHVSGDLNTKLVKDRILHLLYTFGNAPVGITSDVNFYDETSVSNRETIDQWTGRLMNSKYQYEYFISNPKAPHDLLHNKFIDSSQNHWAVKCPHCHKPQILNWDGLYGYNGNLDREQKNFVCQYCKKVLSPETIRDGEWVERFSGRRIAGYWIWQGMRVFESVERQGEFVEKMMDEEKKSKASFYSMFLGLPYGGSDITISKELFLNNLVEPERKKDYVVLGADIGSATGHHITIGSGDTIFYIGRAKDWDEIRGLINKYGVSMVCVDNMPENGAAKELQRDYPNIVWRSNYVSNKSENLIKYDEETGLVNVARNLVFDKIIQELKDGHIKFAFDKDDRLFNEYMEHWETMSKIPKFDALGNPTFSWEAPEGAWDHFCHSTLYWYVAKHRLDMLMPRFGIVKSEDRLYHTNPNARDFERFFSTDEKPKDWYED